MLYGHRPMYCSNSDDIDCSVEYTRKGLPFLGIYSKLFLFCVETMYPLIIKFSHLFLLFRAYKNINDTYSVKCFDVNNDNVNRKRQNISHM